MIPSLHKMTSLQMDAEIEKWQTKAFGFKFAIEWGYTVPDFIMELVSDRAFEPLANTIR